MGAFTAVTTGNTTKSTDINQYANAFNATTGISGGIVLGSSNAVTPWFSRLPSTPGSDQSVLGGGVTGDTSTRVALYLRSTGYGGLWAGSGTAVTANLYATSSGWTIPQSLTVSGTLTVAGTLSLASINTTGGATIGGATTISGALTVTGGEIQPQTTTPGSNAAVTGIDFGNGTRIDAYGGAGLDMRLHAGGYIKLYGDGGWVIGVADHHGWTTHAGTDMMELNDNSGGSLYLKGSVNGGQGSLPDTFDVCETVPVTPETAPGMIVCVAPDGRYAPCRHVGCAKAGVLSRGGGFRLGRERRGHAMRALAGRVRVRLAGDAAAGDWLISDGAGGVRRGAPGEHAAALGYAETPGRNGECWLALKSWLLEG